MNHQTTPSRNKTGGALDNLNKANAMTDQLADCLHENEKLTSHFPVGHFQSLQGLEGLDHFGLWLGKGRLFGVLGEGLTRFYTGRRRDADFNAITH